MSRWKPGSKEIYYYVHATGTVEYDTWGPDWHDFALYDAGNCFRTKAKAEAAAEKVKALLLSLHEETENTGLLPKLTVEVFGRPDCPKWAKFAAVDRGGKAFWFASPPARSNEAWLQLTYKRISGDLFDSSDWQNSLIERPVKEDKLPDWCKVGKWVWDKDDGYGKIDSVRHNPSVCFIVFDGGIAAFGPESFAELKQARFRPYNQEDMKSLVWKTVKMRNDAFLISIYNGDSNTVWFNNYKYSPADLLNNNMSIDGKPCGVIEHLNDNGEWVE